jgi:hypothetical protein
MVHFQNSLLVNSVDNTPFTGVAFVNGTGANRAVCVNESNLPMNFGSCGFPSRIEFRDGVAGSDEGSGWEAWAWEDWN